MVRANVIKLIGDTPVAHGVFEQHTEIMREVMCEVRSVGMRESYTAASIGLAPSYVFVLFCADYANERMLIYRDERYKIIRTYIQDNLIELTAERVTNDV